MKTKSIIHVFLLLTIFMSGCIVKSLHPFYKESDIEFRPELLGTWIDQDSSMWEFSERYYSETFMGKEQKDNSYKVVLRDPSGKEKDSWFIVTLFKIKNATYLDFEPYIEDNVGDNLAAFHFVPSHSVARAEFYSDGNFAFFWYDEEWLNELFEQNRVKISHETIQQEKSKAMTAYVLTASTGELQKFLIKYGEEINIFKLVNRDKVNEGKNYLEKAELLKEEIEKSMNDKDLPGNDLIYSNLMKLDE